MKAGRKIARRLEARVKDYETTIAKMSEKQRGGYRRPGSRRKKS
jgi:hypothetical protein